MTPKNPNWWEQASPNALKARQNVLLRNLIRYRIAPFHNYYREVFAREGISPEIIKSTEDLVRLPFTSKADLKNPKDFVIIPEEEVLKKQPQTIFSALRYGKKETQRRLQEELRPIFMTSTTGRSAEPVPFLYTKQDVHNLEVSGQRLMELTESPQDFRIVNLFPFAPHLAFWQAHYAGTASTTFILSTGGGKTMGTDGNARLISKINPDGLIAMPTFLYHLLQYAAEKELRWTNLKRLVLGGEKVPLGMRRKLRALCAKVGSPEPRVISTYGFTEAKMAWGECPSPVEEEPSGYHVYGDHAFVEIIDPETGERVPEGESGEIVVTNLTARGSVVLRYRTGDMIDGGLVHEPCPYCGRTCPRLVGKISRVSDRKELNINKVKGTLVDFSVLEHVLDDTDDLGAWQIEIRKKNDDPLDLDELVVHAVALENDNLEELSEQIMRRMRHATELRPNDIRFHDWETMRTLQGVGKELKEQKLVDRRALATAPKAGAERGS